MNHTPTLAFLNQFGAPEILIIFLVILLLFGAKKLPELARGIGRSLGEFRQAKDEFDKEIHRAQQDVKEVKKEVDDSITIQEAKDKKPHGQA